MRYHRDILRFLKESIPGLRTIPLPQWVMASCWRPTICLSKAGDDRVVAVDIIPSAVIPLSIYQKEVVPLKRAHGQLRAVVCVLEDAYDERPHVKSQCERLGLGLKVLSPGLGLQTIVTIDLDQKPKTAKLTEEPGWFPEAILRQAKGLDRLAFAAVLDRFAIKVQEAPDDANKTLDLVKSTIDELLQQHPAFRANVGKFMRLSNFEQLLRTDLPNETDHVFHSFRVFLAGCPVINQFYSTFLRAQKCFSGDNPSDLCVEYSWLLTSLFHDIGRTKEKEKAQKAAILEMGDEDLSMDMSTSPARWQRDRWRDATKALGSLGVFVSDARLGRVWDGATIGDTEGNKLGGIWAHLYDELKYHAVMSAFDLLADLFEVQSDPHEREGRRLVVTHAVPAALSILLHDWRLWPQARGWKLCPINGKVLPMAALLVYLDTWDDYKRKGPESVIYVRDYSVTSRGVRVEIVWGDSAAYEAEKIKYAAFKKAVVPLPFPMEIRTNI